jgi:hypothetical protein
MCVSLCHPSGHLSVFRISYKMLMFFIRVSITLSGRFMHCTVNSKSSFFLNIFMYFFEEQNLILYLYKIFHLSGLLCNVTEFMCEFL